MGVKTQACLLGLAVAGVIYTFKKLAEGEYIETNLNENVSNSNSINNKPACWIDPMTGEYKTRNPFNDPFDMTPKWQ